MDLSFIIPCHDLENYIKPLLLSFHAINLEDLETEFIFVLDACSDKTEEVIKNYMFDLNYKIIHCNYHKCGLARNVGFEASSGEYIWFIDGDDWLIWPNTARDCINAMRENDLDIIKIKFVSNLFNREYFSMVWQYMFKRELIADTKFIDIQPCEDDEFMKLIFKKLEGKNMYIYQFPSYYYNYMRPNSNMYQYINTGKII